MFVDGVEVKPVNRIELDALIKRWRDWAGFRKSDEDTRQDYGGGEEIHVRLLATLDSLLPKA